MANKTASELCQAQDKLEGTVELRVRVRVEVEASHY